MPARAVRATPGANLRVCVPVLWPHQLCLRAGKFTSGTGSVQCADCAPGFFTGNGNLLSRGRPATQSSVAWGGYPRNAVDGNRNGDIAYGSCSQALTGAGPSFWQVDLGAEYVIARAEIHLILANTVGYRYAASDMPQESSNAIYRISGKP